MTLTIRDPDGAPVRVMRLRSRDLIDYATRYQRRRGAVEA
jgi:hypothetical protein